MRVADPGHVRLVALGDVGTGDDGQARVAHGVVRTCAERGCDLVVLLGDNLYPRGMVAPDDPRADSVVLAPYADAGAPLYLALGNHDYAYGRDRQRAKWLVDWAGRTAGVELPANAWHAVAGPAELVALDTNAALQWGEGFQARWLDGVLADSDATWRVVLGHHTYRSNGRHGNAGEYDGRPWMPIANGRSVRRLFDDSLCGAADLYLSGHDHSRQLQERCGVDLVVSGGGSHSTGIFDRGNDARFERGTPGHVWLDLGPTEGVVVFLDADGAEEARFTLFPELRGSP